MDDLPLSFNYMGLLPFIIRDHVNAKSKAVAQNQSIDVNVMGGIHGNEKEKKLAAER